MKTCLIAICLGLWALDFSIQWMDHTPWQVDAQGWNVSNVFRPFKFEWTHRGSFNMSICSKEMINCYEIFQLQTVCGYYYKKDSICTAMRRHCQEQYGYDYEYQWYNNLDVKDEFCEYWYSSNWFT